MLLAGIFLETRKLAEHGGDRLNVLLTDAPKLLAAADKQDGLRPVNSSQALDDANSMANASMLRLILKDLAHR
ncbi:hypothetical protein MKZ38_001758 [Zalerion maritima]|uniref:Uncharacterized protein n=1 Tax=Zalerion maritima TaxID=339359 RepID=A0AAD5RZH6_9PEZI|nr:hypothetical protein MKZ38_001758 [Zalerion maritima]